MGAGVSIFAMLVAAAVGWVMNIVKLVSLLDGGVTGWMVGRIVGIFVAPLGSILGFL